MSTAAAIQTRHAGLYSPVRSTGESDSAITLFHLVRVAREHFRSSIAVGTPLEVALAELDEAAREAALPGWNGYAAKPIDAAAYASARSFLELLPTMEEFPEISVDGDGEVELDWLADPRRALTIVVGANGRLIYAWLDGPRTCRGTEWFDEGIPSTIARAISSITSHDVRNRTKG